MNGPTTNTPPPPLPTIPAEQHHIVSEQMRFIRTARERILSFPGRLREARGKLIDAESDENFAEKNVKDYDNNLLDEVLGDATLTNDAKRKAALEACKRNSDTYQLLLREQDKAKRARLGAEADLEEAKDQRHRDPPDLPQF